MENKEYDFLVLYITETKTEMRHLENLSAKISGLIITITSTITGFIVWKKFDDSTMVIYNDYNNRYFWHLNE